jgi:hypothetical protein
MNADVRIEERPLFRHADPEIRPRSGAFPAIQRSVQLPQKRGADQGVGQKSAGHGEHLALEIFTLGLCSAFNFQVLRGR